MNTSTIAPPPEKKPNATPLLRTWTSFTKKNTLRSDPSAMFERTSAFVIWSRPITTATTAPARTKAPKRRCGEGAAIEVIVEPEVSPRSR